MPAELVADGGAIGLQLGPITFGLGGSSKGPILGIGPSPDNGLPIAVPFVPGDSCDNECSSRCSTCKQDECCCK